MKTLPKQIVIDKDVFQGTHQDDLCRFAKNHFLILPDGLMYECITNTDKKDILLHRFEQVMLAGAYICPSIKTIVFKEAQNLSPYMYLADLTMTKDLRRTIQQHKSYFDPHYIQNIYSKHCESAKILLETVPKTAERIISQEHEILENAKKYQGNKSERFRLWVKTVTSKDIHKLAIEKYGNLTDSSEKFCLSEKWIAWHYFCFVCVVSLEYTYLKTVNGTIPTLIEAEHDCQDIEYVTYLSRVDGLLTKDKRLVIPVAKAAFPNKDVFSSLDEVPDKYECCWS